LTGPIGDDGVLTLEFWNIVYARGVAKKHGQYKVSLRLAQKRVFKIATFDQRNTLCKVFFNGKLYFPSICILLEF